MSSSPRIVGASIAAKRVFVDLAARDGSNVEVSVVSPVCSSDLYGYLQIEYQ
jgi:hypothetical protein